MPDSAGLIEYYKLAASILPVLWIGNVLQQLDPNAACAAVQPLDARRRRLETEAGQLRAIPPASHYLDPGALAARIETVKQEPDTPAKTEELNSLIAIRKALELSNPAQALEAAQAENNRRIATYDELLAEAAQLKLAAENLSKRYRPAALLALLALPLAAIGEAAALYGVAGDDHATIITILASVGVLLGGLLLLGPLFTGWLKLLGPGSWIRRGHLASRDQHRTTRAN
jgi:hypothetical protein